MNETFLPEGVGAGTAPTATWLGAAKVSVDSCSISYPWFSWEVHVPGFILRFLGPSSQHRIPMLHFSSKPGQGAGTGSPAPNGALGWTLSIPNPPAFVISTAVGFPSLPCRCPYPHLALCRKHVTSFSQQSFPSQIFTLHFLCARHGPNGGSNEQKAGNSLLFGGLCSSVGEHLFIF